MADTVESDSEGKMADLTKVLGTMIATGMAGRTTRGPKFARYPAAGMPPALMGGRGGLGKTAGLAALAYLGYKAYQDYQRNQPNAPQQPGQPGQPSRPAGGGGFGGILGGIFGGAAGGGAGGLGERLANVLRGQRPASQPGMDDARALLLIRAMIAAAYADGELTPEERRRIVAKLDEAGAGPEEERVIEDELRTPKPLEMILREVNDQETAEQVYLASEIAIRGGSQTEQDYLAYLASRLNITPERRKELDSLV